MFFKSKHEAKTERDRQRWGGGGGGQKGGEEERTGRQGNGRRSGEEIVSRANRSREGDRENPESVKGTVDTVEAVPDLS